MNDRFLRLNDLKQNVEMALSLSRSTCHRLEGNLKDWREGVLSTAELQVFLAYCSLRLAEVAIAEQRLADEQDRLV